MSTPKAFISHNHADKAVAEQIAKGMRAAGVDAWFDKWEIAPGDSLIKKIFTDGLKDCDVFVVLLSPESAASKWVQNELDVALIRRIEELTRVVPVVVRACEIPEALKPLRRLDLSAGADRVVSELADVVLGRWDAGKPAVVPAAPKHEPTLGLSAYALAIAKHLVQVYVFEGSGEFIDTEEIAKAVPLKITPEQLSDALHELEDLGLSSFDGHYEGDDPFDFGFAQAKPPIIGWAADNGLLDFDPVADLKKVMAAVGANEALDAEELLERTGLARPRLQIAVDLIEQLGIADVTRAMGTTLTFSQVDATYETRKWLRENAS